MDLKTIRTIEKTVRHVSLHILMHVLAVLMICGVYFMTLFALDAVMSHFFITDCYAEDYKAVILGAGAIGMALRSMVYAAKIAQGSKRQNLRIATIIAYAIILIATGLLVMEIHMRTAEHMAYAIDHTWWLLASWTAGLLGGHYVSTALKSWFSLF